jgi:PAS domain S-box-containing protein
MDGVKAILTRAADGAMLVDEDGNVVFWNKAAERLLGFRAQEVIGRPCHDVLRGETLGGRPLCSSTCSIGRSVAQGRGVHNFDMQTHTKNGRLVWLNLSSLPVPSKKKGRFLAIHLFRDITKYIRVRQLTEELHRAFCAPEPGASPVDKSRSSASMPKASPPEAPAILPLTEREHEVLRLLGAGEDTNVIADRLCISPATVRNHIQHILEKLGAHSRLQALAIANHSGASPL